MVDVPKDSQPVGFATNGRLALVALAANIASLATIGFWIFAARIRFAAANPDAVADKPPTISGAIADPSVGEPFAFWVTLSGIVLLFGVFHNVLFFRGLRHTVPGLSPRLVTWLTVAPLLILALQGVATLGMYILSNYRFPDHRDAHMMGSYIFFTAQALVVLGGAVLCHVLVRDRAGAQALAAQGMVTPAMLRFRRTFGFVSVSSVVLYLVLFIVKDINLEPFNEEIYWTYTSAEPTLIAGFLVFLALFQIDLLVLHKQASRSAAKLSSQGKGRTL